MKKSPCLTCHADTFDAMQAYCPKCVKEKTFPKTSFWNHRVMVSGVGRNRFASVREVHYSASGRIEGWTAEPLRVVSDDVQGLIDTMDAVQSSLMALGLKSMQGLILDEAELEKRTSETEEAKNERGT